MAELQVLLLRETWSGYVVWPGAQGADPVPVPKRDSVRAKRTHSGAKELFRPFLASRLRARRSTPSAIREFRGGDAPFPPAPATDFQRPSETRMDF